jgi:NTE family protein
MGKVVKLDAAATERTAASSRVLQVRRQRRSKTALVLGGGGLTGGVYEMGALRALDLLSVNRTVNEFDVYVGTISRPSASPPAWRKILEQTTSTLLRQSAQH